MSLFLGFFKEELDSYAAMDAAPLEHDFAMQSPGSKVYPHDNRRRLHDYPPDEEVKNRLLANPHSKDQSAFDNNSAINWLEKVLMGEQIFDGYPQTTYVCILMDLLAYKHVPLTNKAFELIVRFFNQRAQLICLLKQIQLLEHPESIKTLKKVNEVMASLKQFVDGVNMWLHGDELSQAALSDLSVKLLSCKESIDFLGQILVEKTVKASYRAPLKRDSEPSDYTSIPGLPKSSQLFIDVDGNIKTKSEADEEYFIPSTENQRLLRNLGVQAVILQILKANTAEGQKQANNDFIEITVSAYLFLIRF